MKPGHRNPSGFTLVEVLVALVILAFIMGTLFGSLRTTGRNWHVVMARTDSNESLRLGLDYLRRQIEQTVPLRVSDGEAQRFLFDGGPDRLVFVAPLPAHTGAAALHRLTLKWRAVDGARGNLMLVYHPVRAVRDMAGNVDSDERIGNEVSVMEGIGPVSFRYYGAGRAGEDPHWHDSWNRELRMPQRVQVIIAADGPQETWPELIIPLRVDFQSARAPFVLQLPVAGEMEAE